MDAGEIRSQVIYHERLDIASNASDCIGVVKKVIKAGRKIFHSIIFPENGVIANFFDTNTVITRLYYARCAQPLFLCIQQRVEPL